ncbi:Cysteine-rich repeat-containing protein [Trichostrongylus colubriformis]|uniref:Cysteine-rich repeat-containing protein n=1 Tax=Trichostrongylus colubriformis TaxID=6319 RepID=A0AAN8IHG3_TRICO
MQYTLLSLAALIVPSLAKAPTFMNDSVLVRHKRQTFYLCGVFPNQYYSTTACQPQVTCPAGGRYLNVACSFSAQCTPFYSGVSTCFNGCCCTVPGGTSPPASSNRFGFCPSGQLSEVRCSSRGQCQSGQTCMSGLCCTTTGNEWNEACGGLTAFGSCNYGSCSYGVCTASNYCCECPVGRSGGRCNAGQACPVGYTCTSNGFCCPQCPNNVMPFGVCRNGACGGGRTCRAGNICC